MIKSLFSLLLFPIMIFLAGCTSKTVTYLERVRLTGGEKKSLRNKTLQEIGTLLQQECNATLRYMAVSLPAEEDTHPFTVSVTDSYLKIVFNHPHLFEEQKTALSEILQKRLDQLIPVLKRYPEIIIQIVGHAYHEGSAGEMRHYADLRAISAAEYLYGKGLKQDILAKGCADEVPGSICPKNAPHTLCDMRNRRIEIFLYTSKAHVITRCR